MKASRLEHKAQSIQLFAAQLSLTVYHDLPIYCALVSRAISDIYSLMILEESAITITCISCVERELVGRRDGLKRSPDDDTRLK